MAQNDSEERTYYPIPMTPTNSPQVDFESIGKELANDLVIGILIQCLSDEKERDLVRSQLDSLLTCSDHIVSTGLRTILYERSVPVVYKEAAIERFERHIKFLASEIK